MFNRLRRLHAGVVLVTAIVLLGGSAAAATAAPAHHSPAPSQAGAVVTSVNGVPTAGTCGVASTAGTFTIVGENLSIVTVEVSATTTTFTDAADTSPSFADVCVASHIELAGSFSSGTVTASSVTVLPPQPISTNGVVTSLNGVSTADTCGTAKGLGAFTFVGKHLRIVTVNVISTTTFTDSADPAPSFADVCVGSQVKTLGTFSSGALTAIFVEVVPPRLDSARGIVTAVNGASTSGTCGSSGVAGTFTLVPRRHSRLVTVEVGTTTPFTDSADPTPSFADLCVGDHVSVVGTFATDGLSATSVAVLPPNQGHDQGLVTSVNGTSTAGTCGSAASAGAFTLVGNWCRGIVTVQVATTTKFIDAADATPSFVDVCVGGHIGVLGTFSSGTLTATTVAVLAAQGARKGHGHDHGHGHGHGRR